MVNKQKIEINNKDKLLTSLIVSIFFSLTFFFFGTLSTYFSNIFEINASVNQITFFFLIISFIFILFLTFIFFIVSNNFFRIIIIIFTAFSFLLWLQTNIIVWNYGIFDGTGIKWEKYIICGIIDSGIWIIVFFLALKFHKKIFLNVRFISLVILGLQTLIFIYSFINTSNLEKKLWFKKNYLTTEHAFDYSKNKNVIILILDEFQSDSFAEIIKEDGYFSDIFDGFTYFRNSLSGYPLTFLSVPNILTNNFYKNNEPIVDFLNRNLNDKNSFLKLLKNNNFENYADADSSSIFASSEIFDNTKTKPLFSTGLKYPILLLYDTTLFRMFPNFIKFLIYNHDNWFLINISDINFIPDFNKNKTNSLLRNPDNYKISSNLNDLSDINSFKLKPDIEKLLLKDEDIKNNPDLTFIKNYLKDFSLTEKNIFKLYHLDGGHIPFSLDENGDKIVEDRNRITYKNKLKYKLKLTQIFINELKKQGVFDNSIIFIIGDHGSGRTFDNRIKMSLYNEKDNPLITYFVKARAIPLLLVKNIDSHGKIKIDDRPASLGDIGETALTDLHIDHKQNGDNLFSDKYDPEKKRFFGYYSNLGNAVGNVYTKPIFEFSVNGFSWLDTSWKFTGNIYTKNLLINVYDKIPADFFTNDILKRIEEKDFVSTCYIKEKDFYIFNKNIDKEKLIKLEKLYNKLNIAF